VVAVPRLRELLGDPDAEVRDYAAKALLAIGDTVG
jgi:HEAT repeat protein